MPTSTKKSQKPALPNGRVMECWPFLYDKPTLSLWRYDTDQKGRFTTCALVPCRTRAQARAIVSNHNNPERAIEAISKALASKLGLRDTSDSARNLAIAALKSVHLL